MSERMDWEGAGPAPAVLETPAAGRVDRWFRRAVLARLSVLAHGELRLVEGDRVETLGVREAAGAREGARAQGKVSAGSAPLSAMVRVLDPRFYRRLALGGSIGAAEAFMEGWWTTDDLPRVVRLLARNRETLEGMESGPVRLVGSLRRLAHRLRANTRSGSQRNIAAHYDLGNDFYRLFLDRTMMYSCAVFEGLGGVDEEGADDGELLARASEAKLDLICRKLELGPGDRVLEIGTGWGGFAVHAAGRFGCHVTTTTISRRQYDFAVERVRRAGLEERVTVLLEDYRDLEGRYDKLVSIEMIEAVGDRFLELFFQRCSELLEPHGMMLLQAITIADQVFDRYRRSVDFIQRYIFPGSCLPSVHAMCGCLAKATDLRLFHLHDITPDYAVTLRLWRRRFLANLSKVGELGFGRRFQRMWEYYLGYCEGGFEERVIGDVQMLLTKPLCRRAPIAAGV